MNIRLRSSVCVAGFLLFIVFLPGPAGAETPISGGKNMQKAILWALIPGGGHYYLGETETGRIYAGSICGGATGAMLAEWMGYKKVFFIGALIIFAVMGYTIMYMRYGMKKPDPTILSKPKGHAVTGKILNFVTNRTVLGLIFFSSLPAAIAVFQDNAAAHIEVFFEGRIRGGQDRAHVRLQGAFRSRGDITVPARVESKYILLEHTLKQPDGVVAIFHN